MNKNTVVRFVIMIAFMMSSFAFPQLDVLDNVASAIRNGNSKEVAKYFDNNVEITILERESSYSKTQGEMILRDFFSKNQVQGFDLKHRGTSGEGSSYGIGTLKTPAQSFRVYYFVKQKGTQQLIQEMRFEKQN